MDIVKAEASDLAAIVALLADDPIGRLREDPSLPLSQNYLAAFQAISADTNQLLAVVKENRKVVGTVQITFIPGISRLGAWRGQIEGVRISSDYRGSGLGQTIFEWAFEECRKRGCSMVQLTTDKERPEAHKFYEKLGFFASHLGYKKTL